MHSTHIGGKEKTQASILTGLDHDPEINRISIIFQQDKRQSYNYISKGFRTQYQPTEHDKLFGCNTWPTTLFLPTRIKETKQSIRPRVKTIPTYQTPITFRNQQEIHSYINNKSTLNIHTHMGKYTQICFTTAADIPK